VAGFGDEAGKESELEQSLPIVKEGDRLEGAFDAVARQTRPPPRHTEATLLSAMETAGRSIEDEALRQAMKDCGLGTPATRAATIETLLKRKFISRDGKVLVPTDLGMGLIDGLPEPSLASPELTGSWEARLARIARGQEPRSTFMQDIAAYVREMVAVVRGGRPGPRGPSGAPGAREPAGPLPHPLPQPPSRPQPVRPAAPAGPAAASAEAALARLSCPRCGSGSLITGKRGWGCSRWREGCSFVVWFETAGKRLTDKQLHDLITKGKTSKGKFGPEQGRLVLDLAADKGGARFVSE
jgi:DNA topoisomerase-3